jgi:Putative zinc-finger
MNCQHVEQRLSDYLEGLLSRRETNRISAHLGVCLACRHLRDELQAVGSELRAPVELAPRPGIEGRIADRWIHEQATLGAPGRQRSPFWPAPHFTRWALVGAAGLAALPAVLGLITRRPDTSSPPSPLRMVERPTADRIRPTPLHAAHPAGGRARPRLGTGHPLPRGLQKPQTDPAAVSHDGGVSKKPARILSPVSSPPGPAPIKNGLEVLNRRPLVDDRRPDTRPSDEWERMENWVRRTLPARDDFVQIPLPRLADANGSQMATAVESYQREAAVVDPRLSHEVTCAFKATALSDLCHGLRTDTGIQLAAGSSVADEKVTLFCEKLPLRDVMRQLSRPFGYAWLRSKKEGSEYRYELVQDLRSQLLEEELRNRDRNEALLAVQKAIDRYRPFLDLSPQEAFARAKTASPKDKPLLEHLANTGWGPIHMYFRLTPQQMVALRSGEGLAFSGDPYPDQERLPSDLAAGVLQSCREYRVIKTDEGLDFTTNQEDPRALPLTAVPEVHAQILLYLHQSELGQFNLAGQSGYLGPNKYPSWIYGIAAHDGGNLAVGQSPAALQPNNAVTNAKLASDPALRLRISIQPEGRYPAAGVRLDPAGPATASDGQQTTERKVTSAEVLETLHRATGMPIVADFFTRLYKPDAVTVRGQSLFDALNHLADAMRLRWHRDGEGGWLQFRGSSYYHDRLKEVPNRLLKRWQAARREQGMLTLDDLVEIAGLPDAQLDASDMAEGAKAIWGLAEWGLLRDEKLRSHVRYLTSFTPGQRQEAQSPAGFAFTKMTLAQQQRFIANAIPGNTAPLQSLEELAGSVLRVDYTQPGWFEWPAPENFVRWRMTVEPGPKGRRELRAPIRERTREAAVEALRRVPAPVREASGKTEITPTRYYLAIVYIPGGTSTRRPLYVFTSLEWDGVSDF